MAGNLVKRIPTIADLEDPANFERRVKENGLMVLLNQPPPQKFIKENGKVKYLPIEVQKYFLSHIYGRWWVEVLHPPYILANSVVCVARVHVINPITQVEEWQDGVGAVAIQLNKDSSPTDFTQIKANAIQLNAPAAKSYAVSNAISEFGKLLGRDLANKDGLDYSSLLREEAGLDELRELYKLKKSALTASEMANAERILSTEEKQSYAKLHNFLRSK